MIVKLAPIHFWRLYKNKNKRYNVTLISESEI